MDDLFFFCEALGEVAPQIECETAFNGKHALHKLQHERPFFFDIIITDINMPLMDGKSLIEATKTFNHCPPIIILSTTREDPALLLLGAAKVYRKPSFTIQLKKIIEEIIETYSI